MYEIKEKYECALDILSQLRWSWLRTRSGQTLVAEIQQKLDPEYVHIINSMEEKTWIVNDDEKVKFIIALFL